MLRQITVQLLSLYIYAIMPVKQHTLSLLEMSSVSERAEMLEEALQKQIGEFLKMSRKIPITHILSEDGLYSVVSPFALQPCPLVER